MPTVVNETIGIIGDYPTIVAWLAAHTDPVADDKVYRGFLLNNTDEVINPNLGTTKTDATRYRELTQASIAKHAGIFGSVTSAKIAGAHDGVAMVVISERFFRLTHMEVVNTGVSSAAAVRLESLWNGVIIDECLLKCSGTSGGGYVLGFINETDYPVTCRVRNTIIHNARKLASLGIYGSINNPFQNPILENVTEYGNNLGGAPGVGNGIYTSWGECYTLINVICCNNGDADFYKGGSANWHAGTDYNCSEDATAPGAGSLINKLLAEIDFTDVGAGNFIVDSAGCGIDVGQDMSGTYLNDVRGVTTERNDIGASEYAPTIAVWTWSQTATAKEGDSALKAVVTAGSIAVDDYYEAGDGTGTPVTAGEEYAAGCWVKVVDINSGHCYFQVWDKTNDEEIGKVKMTAESTIFVFLPLLFTVPANCAAVGLRCGGETADAAEFIFDAMTCVRFRGREL